MAAVNALCHRRAPRDTAVPLPTRMQRAIPHKRRHFAGASGRRGTCIATRHVRPRAAPQMRMAKRRFREMKRRYVLAALALGLMAVAASHAWGAQCTTGCAVGKRMCMAEARTALASCRSACRGGDSSASCRASCISAVLTARRTCRTGMTDCRTACPAPSPCTGACGAQMAACTQGVQTTGRACSQDCLANGHTAAAACRGSSDPLSCLRAAAAQVAACLKGCANGIHDGTAQCAAVLRSCITACQGGSPSGAFVD